MIQKDSHFNQLLQDAISQNFSGWDFSYLKGRWQEADPSWDYRSIVQQALTHSTSLLDMGTGGGEFLLSLNNRPTDTHATEGWQPNISIAEAQLAPHGIEVHAVADYKPLPLSDARFDLIINRHEWYDPDEVYRILKSEGIFITQQVGDQNGLRLNDLLSASAPAHATDQWNLSIAQGSLETAGFIIERAEEAYPPLDFYDIGAIVYYLKVIEWQIPDFSVDRYQKQLAAVHRLIMDEGKLTVNQHRFLLIARKPK